MVFWTFVERRIESVLTAVGHKNSRPVDIGRPASASTATGSLKRHTKEQAEWVDKAVSLCLFGFNNKLLVTIKAEKTEAP